MDPQASWYFLEILTAFKEYPQMRCPPVGCLSLFVSLSLKAFSCLSNPVSVLWLISVLLLAFACQSVCMCLLSGCFSLCLPPCPALPFLSSSLSPINRFRHCFPLRLPECRCVCLSFGRFVPSCLVWLGNAWCVNLLASLIVFLASSLRGPLSSLPRCWWVCLLVSRFVFHKQYSSGPENEIG